MTIHVNSGLKMYMQSAIASAKTITAATNADPGVFTSTAHGYVDGDVILVKAQGMTQVNMRLFKVYAKAVDTFQLADIDGVSGIDTIAFGVFTSGTAEKVTLGTSITGCQGFSPSGGDIKTVDTTTVHDLSDKEKVVGSSAMSYELQMQWDPRDAAQIAMRTAFSSLASKAFKILWPDGVYVLFYGSVGYSGAPGGDKQGVTTTAAKIVMEGDITNYAL